MPKQKAKIINRNDNTSVFFFDYGFTSALQHANNYIERTNGKYPSGVLDVYTLTDGGWKFLKTN